MVLNYFSIFFSGYNNTNSRFLNDPMKLILSSTANELRKFLLKLFHMEQTWNNFKNNDYKIERRTIGIEISRFLYAAGILFLLIIQNTCVLLWIASEKKTKKTHTNADINNIQVSRFYLKLCNHTLSVSIEATPCMNEKIKIGKKVEK